MGRKKDIDMIRSLILSTFDGSGFSYYPVIMLEVDTHYFTCLPLKVDAWSLRKLDSTRDCATYEYRVGEKGSEK